MIALIFLLKNKYDEGISSGSIGVRSSILITFEQGKSELVARGVKDGMGESKCNKFSLICDIFHESFSV
jgi:hypothetical protein